MDETTRLAKRVWMTVSDTAVELLAPRLFADTPITLRPDAMAVCRPEEIVESDGWQEGRRPPPLEVADLEWPSARINLLLVLAQPTRCPPVRPRARLTSSGFIFHRRRNHLSDGFEFSCRDPDRAIERLTRHGVEQTSAPYTWVAARHGIWPEHPE